jgi:Asp-tRNA(Asn)/Glu-tRNA(Gln) amidotransferase A subunit family amidase
MTPSQGSISTLRLKYLRSEANPCDELEQALALANSNAGKNVYLAQDLGWSRAEASRLGREQIADQPLWGIPVSLKDCFDLAGFRSSCGSKFYCDNNGVASVDSAVASHLRTAGAVITGKTHLHQLAYGITGENHDYGDCVQPHEAAYLTGGSSSGAVASVQEGSAMAAIGTDTGGSIRVPAALCGLAGYRSSITRQGDLWRGGAHLAQTFDTVGWLYRDLADGPMLARVLFDLPDVATPATTGLRIGVPEDDFLRDCEPDVKATLLAKLRHFQARGASIQHFDASWWESAFAILAPIQASEAAALHRGHFAHFEPALSERLAWGESLDWETVADWHFKLARFRARMSSLFAHCDYLLLPCAPMAALLAGADHSTTRARILRYTSPMSLAGSPVVALPSTAGGLQLVGRLGADAELLALSAIL